MVAAVKRDVPANAKDIREEIEGLKEYASMLGRIIQNDEADIIKSRMAAKKFLLDGQLDNYRYTMERVSETINRIRTCRTCIDDCTATIGRLETKLGSA